MKRMLILVMFCVACGGTDEPSEPNNGAANNGAANNGAANNGAANNGAGGLTCDSLTWDTTWSPDSEDLDPVPELTGGTIQDGIYRLEQGTFSNAAFYFQGDEVIRLDGGAWGYVGTWSTDGTTLSFAFDTACRDGEVESEEISYGAAYRADADGTLYFQSDDCTQGGGGLCPPRRYKRVTDLCAESDDFYCRVTNCACNTGGSQ